MSHQIVDHLVNRPIGDHQGKQGFICCRGIRASARFLVREKLRVHDQAMLQVVDSQGGRLTKPDGTEMAGYLDAVRVGRFRSRAQFFRRDVHVRLERSHALRDPEFHGTARILGILELMHLQRERSLPFEIRPRDLNFWPGHFAVVNAALEFEVRVRFNASRRSNRRHASRQIQPRKTRGVLRVKRRRTARRWIIHMVVHADEARDNRAPAQVQHLRAFGNLCVCGVSESCDLSVSDH